MGEKQKSHECDHKKKKGAGDNATKSKKEDQKSSVTVVLKVEMHCEGCASKIIKCVRSFEGVESVKSDWEASKLTVTGKVDPAKIREKLAEKTKKKVDLVSPKKDDNKKFANEKKSDDKKPKEPPVTTAVLKLSLHCQGCIDKINKVLSKTNGIHEKCIDRQKDLVTVTGTMDAKALAESLKKTLKRNVEIVPAKKEKENSDKEKESPGAGAGGKKGKGGGGGGGGKEENGAVPKMEGNRMEYTSAPAFGYAPADLYGFGQPYPVPYSYPYPYPVQEMFSDENANGCSVM